MLRVDRHGTDLQMPLVGGALQLKIAFMFYVQLHSPDHVKESPSLVFTENGPKKDKISTERQFSR